MTYIDEIKDRNTGTQLKDILNSFNNYFCSYAGSVEETRKQVPMYIRKEGLYITYVDYEHKVHTEYYLSNEVDNINWINNNNWAEGNNNLVGDISISSTGYWIINGQVTDILAKGEKGTTPILRSNSSKLQVSYDEGNKWEDITDKFISYPDDEDITVVEDASQTQLLKFKDRKHNPDLASGKGYKILRRHWKEVGGVRKNILTQDVINDANTIYEIRYDFDLGGEEISIPKNCILLFRGGSLRNGTLILDQTVIDATLYQIFYNITTKGYSSSDCQVEWFGAKAYNKLDTEFTYSSDAIQNALDSCFNNIYFNVGVYYIDKTLEMDCKKSLNFKGSYNGTIKTAYNYEINNTNASTLCVLTDIDILHVNCKYNKVPNDISGFISIRGYGILDATKVDNYNSVAIKITTDNIIIVNSIIDIYIVKQLKSFNTPEEAETADFGNSVGIEINNNSTGAYSIYGLIINGGIINFRYGFKNSMPEHCFPTAITFNCLFDRCITAIDFGESGIMGSMVYGEIQSGAYFTETTRNNYPLFIGKIVRVYFDCYIWDLNSQNSKNIYLHNVVMNLERLNYPIFGRLFDLYYPYIKGFTDSIQFTNSKTDLICSNSSFKPSNAYFIDFLTNDYAYTQNYTIEDNGIVSHGTPFTYENRGFYITPKASDNGKSFKITLNLDRTLSLSKLFIEYTTLLNSSYFDNVEIKYYTENELVDTHKYSFDTTTFGNLLSYKFIRDTNTRYGTSLHHVEIIFNNLNYISDTDVQYYIRASGFRHNYHHINTPYRTEIQEGGEFILQGNEFRNVTTASESYLLNANNKGRIYSTAGRHRFFSDSEILSEIQNSPSAYGSGCRFYMYNYEEPKTFIYDKQVNKLYRINMVDNDFKERGLFTEKPYNPYIGYQFFCTDKQTSEGASNGIVIYYKGNNVWVDALGRVVDDNYPIATKGTTEQRPALTSTDEGFQYYDTTLKKYIVWNGTEWVGNNGYSADYITKGMTSERPTLTNADDGFEYYDNVLKKKILWNGIAWVNMDGTAL